MLPADAKTWFSIAPGDKGNVIQLPQKKASAGLREQVVEGFEFVGRLHTPSLARKDGLYQSEFVRFIHKTFGKRENWAIMKPPQRTAQKKLDYPEETTGSRLAAKTRKLASKLTPKEEAEHFRRGMAIIYGGQSKEITGAGH